MQLRTISSQRYQCHTNYFYKSLSHFKTNPHPCLNEISVQIQIFNTSVPDEACQISQEEIIHQLQELDQYDEQKGVTLYPKTPNLKHSFLIYKKDNGEYCILIKPNSKNRDLKNKNSTLHNFAKKTISFGSYKIVKKTGLLITFLADKKTVYSVEPQVTLSMSKQKRLKDEKLRAHFGEELIKDGFQELCYYDDVKKCKRVIYIMPYLGEPITDVWHRFDRHSKKTVALQLIEQSKIQKPNDIKSTNTLFSILKKKCFFIDSTKELFSYTPYGIHHKRCGIYHQWDQEKIEKCEMELKTCYEEIENLNWLIELFTTRVHHWKSKNLEVLTHLTKPFPLSCYVIEQLIQSEQEQKSKKDLNIEKFVKKIKLEKRYLEEKYHEFQIFLSFIKRNASEIEMEEVRIFSLTCMLWDLINPPPYQGLLNSISAYDSEKHPVEKLILEGLNVNPKIKPLHLPLTKEFLKAYECKLSYDELKDAIKAIL